MWLGLGLIAPEQRGQDMLAFPNLPHKTGTTDARWDRDRGPAGLEGSEQLGAGYLPCIKFPFAC